MNPDPAGVDEEMDAVEAASSLLHTNSFLPDPDPAVICPDNLILALYDEGARRLIGVDHGPRTMYKLPNLNFETALAFTTAAGGRMLLAYQMAQGVRTATPRLAPRARYGRTRAGLRVRAESESHARSRRARGTPGRHP